MDFMRTVLLVEDNDDDIFFIKRACQRSGVSHTLSVVRDGDAAINYLSGSGQYADRHLHPLPDLIFLDIQLPDSNGHEVLEWVRSQAGFQNLPVIMLTNSNERNDMERAYELGVTSYLLKKVALPEFDHGFRVILKYWLQLNLTPSHYQRVIPLVHSPA